MNGGNAVCKVQFSSFNKTVKWTAFTNQPTKQEFQQKLPFLTLNLVPDKTHKRNFSFQNPFTTIPQLPMTEHTG